MLRKSSLFLDALKQPTRKSIFGSCKFRYKIRITRHSINSTPVSIYRRNPKIFQNFISANTLLTILINSYEVIQKMQKKKLRLILPEFWIYTWRYSHAHLDTGQIDMTFSWPHHLTCQRCQFSPRATIKHFYLWFFFQT